MKLHRITIAELEYRMTSTLEELDNLMPDEHEGREHFMLQRDQLTAVLASPTHICLQRNLWVGQLINDAIEREGYNLNVADEPEDIASVRRELRAYKSDMVRAFGKDWADVMFEMLREND